MAIIANLEETPRDIYTGAIGFIGPDRQAKFSVAIRTALVNKKTNDAVYGIGGGIVWDSEPAEEYRECLDKARILSTTHIDSRDFELLETLLWTPEDGFFLLDKHLQRIRSSALYFDFECDLVMIESELLRLARRMPPQRHRVRLLLQRDGRLQIAESLLRASASDQPNRLVISRDAIDKNDPFIYHKTTLNMDGELFTPPVDCGLLGGTYREYMLNVGQVKERKIKVNEITSSTEIMLVNSVRGAYPARLCEQAYGKGDE